LEESAKGLLCGYTSEAKWAAVPKEKDIEFTAVARTVDGILTSVLVERFSEDTATYDEYTVDRVGGVRQLKRTIDFIPDRLTREQTWSVREGKATRISELWMQFKTHKPLPPNKDLADLVERPIVVRSSDFPFHVLIVDKHPELWPGGISCIPGSMNPLEARSSPTPQ